MFATATSASPHMASGRVRGLAVTSAKRSALVNLPTIAESGVPGYDFAGAIGLVAPARTPPAIINRLNQEIVRALRQSHMAKRVMDSGAELVSSTPAGYQTQHQRSSLKVLFRHIDGVCHQQAGLYGGEKRGGTRP